MSLTVVYLYYSTTLIHRWCDGATYEGNWTSFKMNGQGKFTWANGDVYEGNYVNDTVEGTTYCDVFDKHA